MADEFIMFLVGGLAIMAALMVVFGFTGFFSGGPAGYVAYYTSPMFVGTDNFDTVETLYARFDANNYVQTNSYNVGSRRVSNGLLFGTSYIRLDLGYSEFTTVSFDVTSTNRYGALLIKMDDNVVVREILDEGHHEFSVGPGRYLEIAAENSEWRVWAPAVYDLQSAVVTASAYPREKSTYTFRVKNLSDVESVRVDFYMESNAGRMMMNLNGDTVYDGAVNSEQTIYLDKTSLDDFNILTFDAGADSKFSGRATIAITRKTLQEKELRVDINLTQEEYDKFSHGTISFDVVDIFRPGGYSVSIVSNGETLLQEYAKLERGYFVMNVGKDNLRRGLNTFIIRPTDGATFTVQGFMTRL